MKSYRQLDEDEKYLVDERIAIKAESGIPEMEAKRQAMQEHWARYTTMDLKNFRQGGEYPKQVIENFKRKGRDEK